MENHPKQQGADVQETAAPPQPAETGQSFDQDWKKISIESNQRMIDLITLLTNQARNSFVFSMIGSFIGLIFASLILYGGWSVARQITEPSFLEFLSIFLFVSGILLLVLLFFRNPLFRMRREVLYLLKLNAILLSYQRQVQHITASQPDQTELQQAQAAAEEALD